MKRGHKPFKRPCKKCGKEFKPHTKFNKMCDECKEKGNDKRRKKEWERFNQQGKLKFLLFVYFGLGFNITLVQIFFTYNHRKLLIPTLIVGIFIFNFFLKKMLEDKRNFKRI